jgi:hypothetical protein
MKRSPVRLSFAFALGSSLALVLLWLLGGGLPFTRAAEYHVCPSGCTYSTIQAAVDDPLIGSTDIIKVAAGTYTGVLGRDVPLGYPTPPASGLVTQVVYITKTVTIQGGYTTGDWTTSDPINNPTLIDAQGQGRALLIAGNIAPTLTGLRLTNGNAAGLGGHSGTAPDAGGGVYMITAAATINNCQVSSNTADRGGGFYLSSSPAILNGNAVLSNTINRTGGGLYLFRSAAILNGNTVRANTAPYYGGGLFSYQSAARFSGNSIISNTANIGGGVYLSESSSTLTNTVVANNRATANGSGVVVESASPRFLHTTIARNTGGDGSGVYVIEDVPVGAFTVAMTNTILVSQTVGVHVTVVTATATLESTLWNGNTTDSIGNVVSGTHNYTGDPRFVNANAGNYHISAGSAAIDRGIDAGVATDLDGTTRPQGSQPDLGAYEIPWYALTVETTGTGGGVVSPTVGTHSYVSGATALVTATPLISSTFAGWSGACTNPTGDCAVTMDAAKSVTAAFAIKTYVITPTAGANGSITPNTPQTVNYGASQMFTIAPNTGYHVLDVSVDGTSVGVTTTYTFANITADHTITAAFAINTYVITPTAGDNGSITPSTPQTVNYGASQMFTITANTGYHVLDVSVDGTSVGVTTTYTFVNVMADHTISATFEAIPPTHALAVTLAGDGGGRVTSVPAGIDCVTGVCAHDFVTGTVVTLTATPLITSTFTGWSGACTNLTGDCVVTMDAAKSVTATFELGAANNPPIANAGPDQTVYISTSVTLNGSASTDPDGNLPLSFGWTQTGGPAVSFNRALSVTTFTAPGTPQVLTFTLTVTDTLGLASTPDTVVLTVRNYSIYLPLVMRP